MTPRKPKVMTLTGNLVEDCKRALDANMAACAAHCSRVSTLKAIVGALDLSPALIKAIGQDPETIDRDLQSARADYQQAKVAYETFCERTGQQTYAVYSED